MDSGFLIAPSFTATTPMMFNHFMGMNMSSFHNGMQNYDTQCMPWVSNHFPIDMLTVPSSFPSSTWPTYMNPSIGSWGTMALLPTVGYVLYSLHVCVCGCVRYDDCV
jgi:hypothetical protein